jgi:hypothetical protein
MEPAMLGAENIMTGLNSAVEAMLSRRVKHYILPDLSKNFASVVMQLLLHNLAFVARSSVLLLPTLVGM